MKKYKNNMQICNKKDTTDRGSPIRRILIA